MLVQHFGYYNEFLDINTKRFFILNGSDKSKGWYKKTLEGEVSSVYVSKGSMYFKYKEVNEKISFSHNAEIIMLSDDVFMFNLMLNNKVVVNFKYNADMSFSDIEPFDYLDYEDDNWGLFLSNVINNDERRERIVNYMDNISDTSSESLEK